MSRNNSASLLVWVNFSDLPQSLFIIWITTSLAKVLRMREAVLSFLNLKTNFLLQSIRFSLTKSFVLLRRPTADVLKEANFFYYNRSFNCFSSCRNGKLFSLSSLLLCLFYGSSLCYGHQLQYHSNKFSLLDSL